MSSVILINSMPAAVFTLTGPTACGKSTIVNILRDCASGEFRPAVMPKFTTRPSRKDDGEEVKCVRRIPRNCDLVYEQYGARYGFRLRELFDLITGGLSPIVIVNDVRTVEDLRNSLGPLVKSVYVFRESPSIDKFLTMARERLVRDEEEYQRRFRKAQAIHRVYIENIQIFDFVILNVGTKDILERQVKGMVASAFESIASLV